MNKKIIVIGGGTFSHVRTHLSLATPAFGTAAKLIHSLCGEYLPNLDSVLTLTKMADSSSHIVTNKDLSEYVDELINDNTTKCIIFNAAVCDFDGSIDNLPSGKNSERLSSTKTKNMYLTPSEKIIGKIRQKRKDIFVVAFKTTSGETPETQFAKGLNLLKKNSVNLVVANDVVTKNNMIITPEEGVYENGQTDREALFRTLLTMVNHRTHLSFTRSTVVNGTPVPWNDHRVYSSLRDVVNFCVKEGAYKKFNGVTTGHFAAKIDDCTFLTSIRKTNFIDIDKNGMVLVKTDGDDRVIAYGARPSVGGQSQRIIFNQFKDTNCIVHFHCPLKDNCVDNILIRSQFAFECGSHGCGENTANGLTEVRPGIWAVMLERHGPNIVFHHSIDPQNVIDFIVDNFDLDKSTSGFEQVYLKS